MAVCKLSGGVPRLRAVFVIRLKWTATLPNLTLVTARTTDLRVVFDAIPFFCTKIMQTENKYMY